LVAQSTSVAGLPSQSLYLHLTYFRIPARQYTSAVTAPLPALPCAHKTGDGTAAATVAAMGRMYEGETGIEVDVTRDSPAEALRSRIVATEAQVKPLPRSASALREFAFGLKVLAAQ
jgi:hypothetical protein